MNMHSGFTNFIAGILSFATALYPYSVANAQVSSLSQNTEVRRQAELAVARIDMLLGAVAENIDHSVFDLNALSALHGGDVSKSFAFVRDEIGYRAYAGNLRGAEGALLDRTGNSLDRSLLLSALLQPSGKNTRVAYGILDPETASRVAMRSFDTAPESGLPFPAPQDFLVNLAAEGVISEAELTASSTEQDGRSNILTDRFEAEFEPAFSELRDVIDNTDLAFPRSPDFTDLTQVSGNHYWVQIENENGGWDDLDPSFASSEIGQGLATFSGSFSPNEIPNELRHSLTIRAVLSVQQDTGFTETPLLEHTLYISDNVGKSIQVDSVPTQVLDDPDQDLSILVDQAADFDEYRFAIAVDDEVVASQYYNMAGALVDTPGGGSASAPMDSISESLGGLFGGGGIAVPAELNTSLVGLRIEFQTRTSRGLGAEPITVVSPRDILSANDVADWSSDGGSTLVAATRNPADQRRALVWQSRVAAIGADLSQDYVEYRQLIELAALGPVLRAHIEQADGMDDGAPIISSSSLPWSLYSIAAAARDAPVMSPIGGISRYTAAPTILSEETSYRVSDSGKLIASRVIDLAQIGTRVAARDEQNWALARDELLRAGVAWTTLERLIVDAEYEAMRLDVRNKGNMIQLLTAAQEQSVELTAITPDQAAAVDGLGLSPALKSELANDLSNNRTIVTPVAHLEGAEFAQHGWWSFDERSGLPIGRALGGRGNTETVVLTPSYVTFGQAARSFAIVLVSVAAYMVCMFYGLSAVEGDGQNISLGALAGLIFSCLAIGAMAGVGIAPGLAWGWTVAAAIAAIILGIAANEFADGIVENAPESELDRLRRENEEQRRRLTELESR